MGCVAAKWCVAWLVAWVMFVVLDNISYHLLFGPLRFSSIYNYDFNLFKKKFLGPPGVSWLQAVFGQNPKQFVFNIVYMTKALQAFWAKFKDTDWFRNHPQLSKPDTWIVWKNCFVMFCFFFFKGVGLAWMRAQQCDSQKMLRTFAKSGLWPWLCDSAGCSRRWCGSSSAKIVYDCNIWISPNSRGCLGHQISLLLHGQC